MTLDLFIILLWCGLTGVSCRNTAHALIYRKDWAPRAVGVTAFMVLALLAVIVRMR